MLVADAVQIVCEAGFATTFGVGLTVTVKSKGVPGQPLVLDGVIIYLTVPGDLPPVFRHFLR